ncbi:hypothetical protein [Chthonobacter albigriseus]|uniref:hypothetical protein n=1 Tax=Chthonobacter albigriseus TaxID=1683161 RepID=UPI0015EEC052|nr:hypothetical protein [Chthonobacter albigriseus]
MRQPLLRLLALNGLAGATAGVVVVTGLLGFDVGGIGRLVAASDNPALPIGMMTFGFIITLASVAMGTAIMRIGSDDDDQPAGGRGVPIPIPVRVDPRR